MSVVGRLVREPLLQFLVLGLLLFVGYRQLNGTTGSDERLGRIELTSDDVRQIALAWVAQGRPAPTPEQMEVLVEARVREEILYREAVALGLDKDDTIVRRRMAQKIDFLLEDVAALREPAGEELQAWFATHAEPFARPARATFRHLYFSPDRRGANAREDAARTLPKLAGTSMAAPETTALADPFMFQDYYGDRTSDDVAKTFGPGFARALFAVAPGAWAGPIESGYGWHLVWVDSIMPARVPALDEVEPEVKAAWLEEQRAELREKAYAAMRARWDVVVPADLAVTDLLRGALSPLAGIAPQ